MNRLLILGILFVLILNGCKKDNSETPSDNLELTTRDKLIGTWRFKEAPANLIHPFMGYYENRTIFSGDEYLTFSQNNDFDVDSIKYGVWDLDSLENINIDMTLSGGYAVGDFLMPNLYFEIKEINDTILIVQNDFYVFYNNIYVLEPVQ